MFSYFLSKNYQPETQPQENSQTAESYFVDEIANYRNMMTSTPDTIETLDIATPEPSESPNLVESYKQPKQPRINKLILENLMIDKLYKIKTRTHKSESESDSKKYMSEFKLINFKLDILAIYCIGLGIFIIFK